jgi:nitroreductase
MNVIEAIHARRSIRAYRNEPVPRALVEELVCAAALAPRPPQSGEAPCAYAVIEGQERLAHLGAAALRFAREHPPPSGPREWAHRPGFDVFWGAPLAVLICAQRGHAEAAYDCCRAAQTLVLAAVERGLGTCWVGSPLPWLRSPGVAEQLGLPAGYEPSAVIALGFAAETPLPNPRPQPAIHWLA